MVSVSEYAMTEREQRLVLSVLRDVDRIVAHYAREHHVPPHHLDDLRSDAHLAVCHAARRYDDTLDVSFMGYVRLRVVGAIVDGIRRRVPGTRHLRCQHVPLAWDSDDDEEWGAADWLSTDDDPAAEAAAAIDLLCFLDQLTDRDLEIVGHLSRGELLADIGARYGITESRLSQIRRTLLDRYRGC